MSLQDKVARQLSGLAGSRDTLLVAEDEAGRMEADLVAVDSIGCAFRTLTLHTPRLADATIDELKKLSTQLAERLNYLLEPIAPIESDAESCTVQMRSKPPQRDQNGSRYYELLVRRGGQLCLCRYNKPKGEPREVVPAQVTQEVFVRLVGDFEAAVAR